MKNYENPIKLAFSAPFDPNVYSYNHWDGMPDTLLLYEYTNWQEETLSWKENCYLASSLANVQPIDTLKGPDAEKLLSRMCVNNFSIEKFPIGKAKHVISCTPIGTISAHGVVMRLGKDHFDTTGLQPDILAYASSGEFDVEPIPFDYEKDILLQLAGPKSLEVVENVIKEDVHDLKFMTFKNVEILGCPARLLRMGMGGTLAYEFHFAAEYRDTIFNEIVRVGKDYNLHKLGYLAYLCNHTENGFPQGIIHFMCDWESNPLIAKFQEDNSVGEAVRAGEDYEEKQMTGTAMAGVPLCGSLATEGRNAYFLNPIEAGWEKMIYWDHDFVGKEALQKIAADPTTRRVCTLEWNPEDVLKVYANYLTPGEPLTNLMKFPKDLDRNPNGNLADKVVDENGNMIGKSTGRVYTLYYRSVISMAFLDPEFAEIGKEVTVIWGDPDMKQIPIRAKVARYPYLDLPGNKDFDIESIPHYKG